MVVEYEAESNFEEADDVVYDNDNDKGIIGDGDKTPVI